MAPPRWSSPASCLFSPFFEYPRPLNFSFMTPYIVHLINQLFVYFSSVLNSFVNFWRKEWCFSTNLPSFRELGTSQTALHGVEWTATAALVSLTLAGLALDAQWSQACMKLFMGSSLWFMRGRVVQAWPQFQVQESDPLTEVPSCTGCVLWATHWTSLLSWVSYLQSTGSNSTWPGMLGRSHKTKQLRCLAESPVCRTYSLSATWLMELSPGEGHDCRHWLAVIILLHILHLFIFLLGTLKTGGVNGTCCRSVKGHPFFEERFTKNLDPPVISYLGSLDSGNSQKYKKKLTLKMLTPELWITAENWNWANII